MSLADQHCVPCKGGTPKLDDARARELLAQTSGWEMRGNEIVRIASFKNYYETTAFVNAVVWIAHREDHHPDITFGYKTCTIRLTTHAAGGLTENDFICAAKISALLPGD